MIFSAFEKNYSFRFSLSAFVSFGYWVGVIQFAMIALIISIIITVANTPTKMPNMKADVSKLAPLTIPSGTPSEEVVEFETPPL